MCSLSCEQKYNGFKCFKLIFLMKDQLFFFLKLYIKKKKKSAGDVPAHAPHLRVIVVYCVE